MSLREDIAQQALSLAPADRLYVVDILEQSLANDGSTTPEIADAWAAEIEQRIDAYDRGDVPATDFETAVELIRQDLAERRDRCL